MGLDFHPDPKPAAKPKKPRRTNLETSAAWYQNVIHKRDAALWTAEDYPAVVGAEPLQLQAHHIIPRQQCRKHGVPEWDVRNGMPVTKRRHERHHSRVEPIHRSELPDEIFLFLADYPALWPYFTKTYPASVLPPEQEEPGLIARSPQTGDARGGEQR